ncbi:cell surface protein [Candidatus Scalindua japonica]|uniref:Cell surface protein n=1 Tax=Candidatus Scalindua japonica TaxID=1284222 RepID=A0A286U044_9BACT|nr:PKD domain-containing protein [Candidatus Scalindua japonica]GAX61496.1 cell surface protein [Candidatus Scalindua japonica]
MIEKFKGISIIVGIISVLFVREATANLIADFTTNPVTAIVNEQVEFDASVSFDDDPFRNIVQYEWDFDADGQFDFIGIDPLAFFTYTMVGDFDTILLVTNDGNPAETSMAVHSIHVSAQSVPEPSLGLLLGLTLVGLVGVGGVRKIKQKEAVANT